ncbi:septum formation protein Maf [bacterium CG2_30_54_10]|nr:MAG: septum formation protein Maf [bacterium CG2_30_54_10]
MNPAPSKRPIIYLASRSPRRRAILTELCIPFKELASSYDERAEDVADLPPADQAIKLASLKAFHAAKTVNEGIVIGADTIVVLDSTILGKPRDRDDAKEMLNALSGKTHQVITGVAVVDVIALRTVSRAEITKVFFKPLREREIYRYLETNEPYDKAGAYAIQGMAALFVERIEGCYFNVVGFPVRAFSLLMTEIGFDILDFIDRSGK